MIYKNLTTEHKLFICNYIKARMTHDRITFLRKSIYNRFSTKYPHCGLCYYFIAAIDEFKKTFNVLLCDDISTFLLISQYAPDLNVSGEIMYDLNMNYWFPTNTIFGYKSRLAIINKCIKSLS